mmetsp:Transcript_30263/g.39919  ORF Transcript_30263/g.39919 Transcript_30263/m.39919 type:complete len:758 (+) Transcript_30263:46-2319(+)
MKVPNKTLQTEPRLIKIFGSIFLIQCFWNLVSNAFNTHSNFLLRTPKAQNLDIIKKKSPNHLHSKLITPKSSNFRLESTSQVVNTDSSVSSKPSKGAPVIWCEEISHTFDGERFQFRDISLTLHRGEKLGLIGLNGAGKSSLLKALAGELKPDSGKIDAVKKTRVVYVKQEPKFAPGLSVRDAIFGSDIPVMVALKKYYEASERLETEEGEDAQKTFERASQLVESLGGWEVESNVAQILTKLNVYHLIDQTVDGLSGGELKRLALGIGLIEKPDVLLLDEPTNHLDVNAIQWVETLIKGSKDMACLVVTHDRVFLENIADEIVELDRSSLFFYPGVYNKYLEAKAARLQQEDQEYASLKNKLRRELEWVRRQPQGRQAKSKSRVQAYEEMNAKAKSREIAGGKVSLNAQSQRLGNFILKFENANLAFKENGKTILKDFSYEFSKNDRLGIVGGNGVGKTTFLNILTQNQALDSGDVSVGETVVYGYYNQKGLEAEAMDITKRVIEYVQEIVENNRLEAENENPASTTRKYLEKFQFPKGRWHEKVENLSGGERRRLQLLSVLCKNPNFLVLDEPTNDLDLQTLSSLEDFLLNEYKGCIILVSHDRLFMDRVTNHLFVFEGDGIVKDFVGSFTDYLAIEQERQALQQAQSSSKKPTLDTQQFTSDQETATEQADEEAPAEEKKKLSYKERKEYTNLEAQIEKLTEKQSKLEIELEAASNEGQGYSELMDIQTKLDKVTEEINEKEERWLELAEIIAD